MGKEYKKICIKITALVVLKTSLDIISHKKGDKSLFAIFIMNNRTDDIIKISSRIENECRVHTLIASQGKSGQLFWQLLLFMLSGKSERAEFVLHKNLIFKEGWKAINFFFYFQFRNKNLRRGISIY